MKTLSMYAWGKVHPMTFEIQHYLDNGNLYVGLLSNDEGYPEPWQNLTVNLGVTCNENCGFIDTNNNGNGIIDWLVENGLCKPTGRIKASGFCMYPEFEFNMEKLKEYVN